jgi:Predicted metal-dependent hydrolase with the TIM-barrel fold
MLKKIFPLIFIIYGCSSNDIIEKVYYNGIIWTGDKDNPSASAILIQGDKVSLVGMDDEVLSRSSNEAEKIDLEGRFVTPGLIDNHVHFMSGGLQLSRVDLRNAKSKKEFQEIIAKADND